MQFNSFLHSYFSVLSFIFLRIINRNLPLFLHWFKPILFMLIITILRIIYRRDSHKLIGNYLVKYSNFSAIILLNQMSFSLFFKRKFHHDFQRKLLLRNFIFLRFSDLISIADLSFEFSLSGSIFIEFSLLFEFFFFFKNRAF